MGLTRKITVRSGEVLAAVHTQCSMSTAACGRSSSTKTFFDCEAVKERTMLAVADLWGD
jgi:hypothetical protein